MMNIKVMQINITCGVGSTGRLSEMLYYATIKKGWKARFAYSMYHPTIKAAFSIENKIENGCRRLLNKVFGKKQKHSNIGTRKLIRYIKSEKPDIIHLHNIQHNFVNYYKLFQFLKEINTPVVYTLHDCWPFTGGCYHFSKIGCNKYEESCSNCPKKRAFDDVTISPNKSHNIKETFIGGNDNMYPVCVSKWLCSVATKSYMGKMKHLPQVVYNGIDTQTFMPKQVNRLEKVGVDEKTFVILGVASFWNDDKGLLIFKELANKLDFPVKIILIGGGLENLQNLNLEKIICVSRTESVEELAEYYSLADVFINTSIEETFGLTTAEALACGTPAIVFNFTACPEVIDEDTGVCVPHQMEALIEGIEQIREKGKAYYTEHCRERVLKLFSKEKMVDEYLKLYEDLLNG